MTASELLKEYIVEKALKSIPEKEREQVKTFDDLVEWCKQKKSNFKYDLITDEIIDSDCEVHHNKQHDEYSRFDNQYVYKIKDKFIEIWFPSDENLCTYEFIDEILEGINKAVFVEPYQELITFYKRVC